MATIPNTINKVLNLYSHLISDVGKEIALPGIPKIGWIKYSEIFCDSIILWALHNKEERVDEQRKDTVTNIRESLTDLNVKPSMIKVLNEGTAQSGDEDFFSREILEKHKKKFKKGYCAGYFSIKVTLHEISAISLLSELQPLLDELEQDYIFLHDIDIATDCRHVTSRPILKEYLEDKFGDDLDIVDDFHKVGNHCLSWFMETSKEQKIRCKVYNKFVQMLESAEVRMSLGSRMENLVMNADDNLQKRLCKAKKTGLTRLEITFYGQELYKFSYYQNIVESLKEEIQDCPTFCVPFKKYWKYVVSNISSMIGIHITMANSTAFAYCHWWNSITCKKYGSFRDKVEKAEAMVLLANYSFNDRPIYFVEVIMDGDKIKDTTITTYKRRDGCTAHTLVAGAHKSLYPYLYDDDVLRFKDMGIVATANVKIQWPKTRIRKGAPPIAIIQLDDSSAGERFIQVHNGTVHKATYKPGHIILKKKSKYTVIGVAMDEFRNKEYVFATLSNGDRVKCGQSLEKKIRAWLDKYDDGCAPYMLFRTVECKTIHGYKDIIVK